MTMKKWPAPIWIALSSGIGAFCLRIAANDSHPIYVGIGSAAIVFAITYAIRAIDL